MEELIVAYGTNAIGALLVLIIGLKIASFLTRKIELLLEKRSVDVSLKPFLLSIISWTLKIVVFLAAANTAGVKTTSFLAVLGSVGLAVGLALQGSLSNFAGGVIILLLKPFKVGDFIDNKTHSGTVKEITVFYTILKTPDNKIIYIPNGGLANSSLINVNHEDTRRVDWTFGIGYDDDIDKAKTIIREIITSDERVLKDPEIVILVTELADSSVNIVTRAWVNTPDYWGVFHSNMEQVKKTFDEKGISIPFPQRDVHLHQVQN